MSEPSLSPDDPGVILRDNLLASEVVAQEMRQRSLVAPGDNGAFIVQWCETVYVRENRIAWDALRPPMMPDREISGTASMFGHHEPEGSTRSNDPLWRVWDADH